MGELGGFSLFIVIAGAGQVGRRVAGELVDRNHDVVIIDNDPDVCDNVSMSSGAKVVCGDASDINILKKSRIDKADVCLGLIGEDSANLAFTILSSSFDVPNILVRTRDPSYRDAYIEAGADRAINTVDIYMDSFLLEIERPSIEQVADLGAGEASVVIVEIPEDSPVEDMRIAEIIMEEEFPTNCVFAGIFRGGEFTIPRGNEKIKANDRVFLAGDSESIRQAATTMGAVE